MQQPKTTLSIDTFGIYVNLANNFVCGNDDAGEFQAQIELTVRGLDRYGFVTEVKALRRLVREAYGNRHGSMLKASCEELAGGVVNVISKVLGERLESCTVAVFNQTGSVSLEWQRGEEVPAFPRKATDAEIDATGRDTERRAREGLPAKQGC